MDIKNAGFSGPASIFSNIQLSNSRPVMDGYDTTKEIRKLDREDKNLPIIAMTADAFSGDIQKCLDCGMNAHIQKPIDIKECLRVLQKYLV